MNRAEEEKWIMEMAEKEDEAFEKFGQPYYKDDKWPRKLSFKNTILCPNCGHDTGIPHVFLMVD